MGLAASQARLLTLTSRMHDVELKQQNIANAKMRLANETEEVSNAYTKALNTQRFKMTLNGLNGSKDVKMNVANLYQPGSNYMLQTKNGKWVLPSDEYQMLKALLTAANDPNDWGNRAPDGKRTNSDVSEIPQEVIDHPENNGDYFNTFMSAKFGGVIDFANEVMKKAGKNITWDNNYAEVCKELGGYGGGMGTWQAIANYAKQHNVTYSSKWPSLEQINYYENMFKTMAITADKQEAIATRNGRHTYTQLKITNLDGVVEVPESQMKDEKWLYSMIESGEYRLVTSSGAPASTSSATDISTEYDKDVATKAEAEYNAATAKINKKEKMLDMDAKKLDTEYSAMTTEYDSLKEIISKNTERTFQLFS